MKEYRFLCSWLEVELPLHGWRSVVLRFSVVSGLRNIA